MASKRTSSKRSVLKLSHSKRKIRVSPVETNFEIQYKGILKIKVCIKRRQVLDDKSKVRKRFIHCSFVISLIIIARCFDISISDLTALTKCIF